MIAGSHVWFLADLAGMLQFMRNQSDEMLVAPTRTEEIMAPAADPATSSVAVPSNGESCGTDRETQTLPLDADIFRDRSALLQATTPPAAQTPEHPQVPPIDGTVSRWWTARRAAAYIGAGPKEIYRAVRSGRLKAVRLNRRGDIRTLREWVDDWMEQLQRDGAAM